MKTVLKILGNVGGVIYLLSISVLTYYILSVLKDLSGYQSSLQVNYLTIFISLLPINIPLKTNTDVLAIGFISIYTLFTIIDTIRKIDSEKPISKMYLLASMIFVISVGIEYLQDLLGIKTGYPEASNDYEYFISAIVAPLTEEIGFRLTVIGLTSLILYFLISTGEKRLGNYLKAFLHPKTVFSENHIAIRILYWMVGLTSILFGLAHIVAGGWEMGKVTLAIVAGLFLGHLFIEYGFITSVLGHAYFNVYLLSLYFFYTLGDKGELGLYSVFASYIGQIIYIFLSMGVGVIVAIYYFYLWIDRKYISKQYILGDDGDEI